MNEDKNGKTKSQEEFDKKLEGIEGKQTEIKKDTADIKKELTEVKNNLEKRISALEKKIKKNSWGIVIVFAIGVGLIGILSFCFMDFIWQTNHKLSRPDVVVFVSLVAGIAAIVITALVTLMRKNSEE